MKKDGFFDESNINDGLDDDARSFMDLVDDVTGAPKKAADRTDEKTDGDGASREASERKTAAEAKPVAKDSVAAKAGQIPAKAGRKKHWKGIIALIIIGILIILAVLISSNHRKQVREDTIRDICSEFSALPGEQAYDSLQPDEKRQADCRMLISLVEDENWISSYLRNRDTHLTYEDIVDWYISHSQSDLKEQYPNVDDWAKKLKDYDIGWITYYFYRDLEQMSVYKLLHVAHESDELDAIVSTAYPEEMKTGSLRIAMTGDERYPKYRNEEYAHYGDFTQEEIALAKEWLKRHGYDYDTLSDQMFADLEAQYQKVQAEERQQAQEDYDEDEDEDDEDASYGSGGGASGSGTIYKNGEVYGRSDG